MPFQIVRNDITRMQVDAIVCPTDETLRGEGGTDGAIHRTAGEKLDKACRKLGGCRPGQAKLTKGFDLPCRYVIHTVGPRWKGGEAGEEQTLRACYQSCLSLAASRRFRTLAFPLIAAGTFGFPKERALRLASEEIAAFLNGHEMTVYLVVFGGETLALGRELFDDIREYIDDHYAAAAEAQYARENRRPFDDTLSFSVPAAQPFREEAASAPAPTARPEISELPRSKRKLSLSLPDAGSVLSRRLDSLDESFQQTLLRKIDERGMTDVQCYKRANIDRKLFSKIRGDVQYRPSKTTAIAFAIALEMDIRETEDFLRRAGFALSNSSKFDVIVRYFIESGRYDIFEINEVLFYYDQTLLGA